MIPIFGKAGGSGGGGGVTPALVAHVLMTPPGDDGGTSGAITTTGANLGVLTVGYFTGSGGITVNDSKSNTWTLAKTVNDAAALATLKMFYCLNPIVGTLHTVSVAGANSDSTLTAAFYSGIDAAFGLDQTSAGGSTTIANTIQPGPITPGASGSLIVTGIAMGGGDPGTSSGSINSGYTITDQLGFLSGTYFGTAQAYLVQSAAAAINPTWSWTGTMLGMAAAQLSFRHG